MAKTPTSFSLPKNLVEALKQKSYEQTAKRGKRVTASDIVVEALLLYGITPK